jgi:hypothetical protein
MNQPIQLPLRAKHFKGTEYKNCTQCAISKAAMDYLDVPYCNEGVSDLSIYDANDNRVHYYHTPYAETEFDADALLADAHNFDDTIIRVITLTLTP